MADSYASKAIYYRGLGFQRHGSALIAFAYWPDARLAEVYRVEASSRSETYLWRRIVDMYSRAVREAVAFGCLPLADIRGHQSLIPWEIWLIDDDAARAEASHVFLSQLDNPA